MFQLVGVIPFDIHLAGRVLKCKLEILPDNLNYSYRLFVDGKTLEQFSGKQRILHKSWVFDIAGQQHSVVLGACRVRPPCRAGRVTARLLTFCWMLLGRPTEKDSLGVWVDGEEQSPQRDFTDEGTETAFEVAGTPCYILTVGSRTALLAAGGWLTFGFGHRQDVGVGWKEDARGGAAVR